VGAKEAVGSSNGTGGNAEYGLASCFDDAKERKMPMAALAHWRNAMVPMDLPPKYR